MPSFCSWFSKYLMSPVYYSSAWLCHAHQIQYKSIHNQQFKYRAKVCKAHGLSLSNKLVACIGDHNDGGNNDDGDYGDGDGDNYIESRNQVTKCPHARTTTTYNLEGIKAWVSTEFVGIFCLPNIHVEHWDIYVDYDAMITTILHNESQHLAVVVVKRYAFASVSVCAFFKMRLVCGMPISNRSHEWRWLDSPNDIPDVVFNNNNNTHSYINDRFKSICTWISALSCWSAHCQLFDW